ncbi:MAG TPA: aldo/keto reductase, partial [Candidatus Binataceae bacterium]|nr:aldo/keto reductase [Candidatus Binataceae bacterium]
MEYRKFGKTGIDISAIGFGCWEIGGGYGSIEETEFIRAINRALDSGINSYDTAEAYGFGASEKSLAKALGKRRKEAVITTKFGVGYPDAPNYRDSSRKRVTESIEKSLKALETDYVDVYLIHWPDRNIPFEEPMRALDDLVKQGKVRAVGL